MTKLVEASAVVKLFGKVIGEPLLSDSEYEAVIGRESSKEVTPLGAAYYFVNHAIMAISMNADSAALKMMVAARAAMKDMGVRDDDEEMVWLAHAFSEFGQHENGEVATVFLEMLETVLTMIIKREVQRFRNRYGSLN